MEKIFLFVIVFMLFGISGKLDELKNQSEEVTKKKKNSLDKETISKFIGKTVIINIDQDEIDESYLFDAMTGTQGIIREVDDLWLVFEYETRKEKVTRYFRLVDVSSIDEVRD